MISCILSGVGGQGTVLASKLLAKAAMASGLEVRTTETIGMAQRGGSVVSHIRMGETVDSPIVPEKSADVIIAFEPSEAVRVLPYLKENGTMLVCDSPIMPVTSSLGGGYDIDEILKFLKDKVNNLTIFSGDKFMECCGNAKALNVALLGTAANTKVLPFNTEILEYTIKKSIPEKFLDMNMKAYDFGKRCADDNRSIEQN